MSDIQVHHLTPQEYVEFELSSREPMQVRIAYLGQVPDTDKASFGVQVRYAGTCAHREADGAECGYPIHGDKCDRGHVTP